MDSVGIGIVGCGSISSAYFSGAQPYSFLNVVACADLIPELAQAKGQEHGCEAVSVDEIFERDDVQIIVNLTVPQAHIEIATRALESGKHTHSEKPLAVSLEEGRTVVELAKAKGLRMGCAPDTFMGNGAQTCRKIIDEGQIGRPVAGTAFMLCHGHENWHHNPEFYYLPGGGPMMDMGPYYLHSLINLLGPARRVCASSQKTFEERVCTSEKRAGEILPVEVTTHLAGTIDFKCGAIITMVMSFDVWTHRHVNIEIYGSKGSLQIPDPNHFGGPVYVALEKENREWREHELTHGYDGSRCIGVADMAKAIHENRPHRCNGDLALHALEIMQAFDVSSETGRHVILTTDCERPEALPTGLAEGEL